MLQLLLHLFHLLFLTNFLLLCYTSWISLPRYSPFLTPSFPFFLCTLCYEDLFYLLIRPSIFFSSYTDFLNLRISLYFSKVCGLNIWSVSLRFLFLSKFSSDSSVNSPSVGSPSFLRILRPWARLEFSFASSFSPFPHHPFRSGGLYFSSSGMTSGGRKRNSFDLCR